MASWKFPDQYAGTAEYIKSPDYEQYIQAFGVDHSAAKAALVRLIESPMLTDAPADRAYLLHELAHVLASMGDREGAVLRLQEADLASTGSPFMKFYEGSFFIDRLGQADRALDIAKETLELLGSPERGSDEQRLMSWIVALKGRCESDLGWLSEAHLSLCRLITLKEEDGIVTDQHTLELCNGLLRYEESKRDAKIYLGFILEASKRRGDPDERPFQRSIESLLK